MESTNRTHLLKRLGSLAIGAALISSLSLGSLVSAQDATPVPYTGDLSAVGGSITADGSSTVGPVTEAVAEEFRNAGAGTEVTVDISGTGGGFDRFCQGDTDLQNASRAIDEEEMAICAENGVAYYELAVAFDGITVVVNPENDFVTCMTVDQLAQLWAPDSQITTWNQLDPSWPEETISLYGPGTDSGTFDYFTDAIVGEEGASRTDYTPSEDDNVLVQGVAGDENALGYFGYAYYEQNQDSLKVVEIDGGNGCVAPSPETIADGSYTPLARPLYVYLAASSLQRAEVQEFMRFYIASAPELVPSVGYVAAPGEAYVADQQKLEGAIAGTVAPDSALMATPTA